MEFEDIKEKVTDLAQAGAAKAREIAETTKLKMNNASEEEAIRKTYIEIGKLYYKEHGQDGEAAYAALCEKINASLEKIEYNKQKMADIKASGNVQDADVHEADEQAEPTSDSENTENTEK